MFWLVLVGAIVLFGIGLKSGYIGVYGSAVERAKNPVLYWGQMTIIGVGCLVLALALLRGDL